MRTGGSPSKAVLGLVAVVALVASASTAGAATKTPSTTGEAAGFQLNAAHDGYLPTGGPTPPLVKRWSRNLGGQLSYPLVAEGKVFVTATNPNGTYGTYVSATDAVTGHNAWGPIPLGGTYFWSALAYGDGAVYAVNADGVLRAFEASTGLQRWIVRLPGQYSFSSAPTYLNGIVYTGGAGSGGTVYAVSSRTGRVLWTRPVANGDNSSPAVTEDGVYVSYACENVYDFDPVSGEPLWTSFGSCSGGGGDNPVVAHGLVWVRDIVSSPVALDAETGDLALAYSSVTAPAFDEDRGYFREGSNLVAREPHTQFPIWSFSGDGHLSTAPIVVGDVVYVASGTGMVYALDAATGVPIWSDDLATVILPPNEYDFTRPISGLAAGNGLFVVPANNVLVAYGSAAAPPPPPALPQTFGWGWNPLGAVGDLTTVDRHQPAAVLTAANFASLSAGVYHSLGVTSAGNVQAWGWNGVGQLGDATTADHHSPVTIPGLSNVTAVSAGSYHSLALRADGTVWAWGWNIVGQLGDGTTTDSHQPVQVPDLSNVVAISAGTYHSLALRADGTVWAWGWNGVGQLGDGTVVDHRLPAPVAGLSNVAAIDAGAYHNLAIEADGTTHAWGWNALGQLGDGTTTDRSVPVLVPGASHAVAVSAGIYHSLALADDATVSAWGWNGVGAVGDGTTTDRHTPVLVHGLQGITAIDAGGYHNLAVTDEGDVFAWGWNGVGQLGDGTTTDRHEPVAVPGAYGVTAVGAGAGHSVVA